MSDTTPAEAEVTNGTVEFQHFGRTWTVPARQRLSHKRSIEARFRATGSYDVAIIDTFLDADQLRELERIDPDDQQLDAFTTEIARAMGYGNSGNS